MRQLYLLSNPPGGFHESGSLAGNEASEFSLTMSRDSDPFKPTLEHSNSTAAATMDVNSTIYLRRYESAMCIFFGIRCFSPRNVIPRNRISFEYLNHVKGGK
jgi:hypothetical protein